MAAGCALESLVTRLLVTGATGFIGQHLVPQLLAANHDVAILLRENYGMGEPLPPRLATVRPHLQTVYADLRNFNLASRAVREANPERVIHLAAAGVTNPFLRPEVALRHNLTGTLNLLRACFEKRTTMRQALVARTPGERSAMNVYAASKAAAWNFCQMYTRTQKWPLIGAMIFQAYGPGQPPQTFVMAAFRAALAGRDFPMTVGRQQRDWIYVEDVVQGLAAALAADLSPGTTVELGTGRASSLLGVGKQIYEIVGRGGRPRPGALPERPGEAATQIADAARTANLLQWQAPTTLEQGLRALHQHLLQKAHDSQKK